MSYDCGDIYEHAWPGRNRTGMGVDWDWEWGWGFFKKPKHSRLGIDGTRGTDGGWKILIGRGGGFVRDGCVMQIVRWTDGIGRWWLLIDLREKKTRAKMN